MGIRVRIEVTDSEGRIEAASEFVDRENTDVDRMGYLLGYAVQGVEGFLIRRGTLSDGMCELVDPTILGNGSGDSA